MEFVNVTSQAELDAAVNAGNIPICRNGFFYTYGSATVGAYDSATVGAYGSATVGAYGSATVRASKYVAIHRHRTGYGTPKVNGGVLIDVPEVKTAQDFIDYYGLEVKRGWLTVFKLVRDDGRSGYRALYEVGAKTSCDDWNAEPCCGGGLHFSPRPFLAHRYSDGTRYLECQVKVSEAVVIGGDKIKAPACRVVREVDADGEPLPEREKVAA